MNSSKVKHVWFMRHGQTIFNPENCTYDEFIEALSNGYHTPLHENHGIDFASLPQNVELICHSPALRAKDTAKKLQEHLKVGSVERLDLLREVRFDKNLISRSEYKFLKRTRPPILKRWFSNENRAESFKDSMARVKEIEKFIQNRQEKTIIIVTHGWFLRLLELYFVKGKREKDITLSDLLNIKPIGLADFVEAPIKFRNGVASKTHLADAISQKKSISNLTPQLNEFSNIPTIANSQ